MTHNISRRYLNEIKSFVITLISLVFFRYCFVGTYGNTAEEWSISITLCIIFLCIKEKKYINLYYFLCGAAAMAVALIRVTDSAIIGSCIIFNIVMLLKNKEYKQLSACILYTGLGAITVLLPFVVYYAANNALYDMVDAILLFSIKYAGFHKIYYPNLLIIFIFPLSVGIYTLKKYKEDISVLLLIMSVFSIILYAVIGTTYAHYMTIGMPSVILSVIIVLKNKKSWLNIQFICIVLAFCLLSHTYITDSLITIYGNIKEMITGQGHEKTDDIIFAEQVDKIIDNKNSVYIYYAPCTIPLIADIYSRSKYFQSQVSYSKNEEIKNKIYEDFINVNEPWVITRKYSVENGDSRITDKLNSDYNLVYEYGEYLLYNIK